MNQQLTNEVIRLQSVVNKGLPLKEEKPPLTDQIRLKMRLKKINEQRQACYSKFNKRIKRALK